MRLILTRCSVHATIKFCVSLAERLYFFSQKKKRAARSFSPASLIFPLLTSLLFLVTRLTRATRTRKRPAKSCVAEGTESVCAFEKETRSRTRGERRAFSSAPERYRAEMSDGLFNVASGREFCFSRRCFESVM